MEKNIKWENWILRSFKDNKITKVELTHSSNKGCIGSHPDSYYLTFELGVRR